MSTPASVASTGTRLSSASCAATGEVMDFKAPAATTGRARPRDASRPVVVNTANAIPSGTTAARARRLARTTWRNWQIGTAIATTAGPSSQLIQAVACSNSTYRRPVDSRIPTITTMLVNPGCSTGRRVRRNTHRQTV